MTVLIEVDDRANLGGQHVTGYQQIIVSLGVFLLRLGLSQHPVQGVGVIAVSQQRIAFGHGLRCCGRTGDA